MPLDEFIHDARDKGTGGYRVSPRRYSGVGSNKFVALNNGEETIEEQSMSYRAGTERDSGDDYRAAKVDRDRSASTAYHG